MKCTTDKGRVIHLIRITITKEILIFEDVNKLVIKFTSPLGGNFENFSFISSCFLPMFTAMGCPFSCVSGILASSPSAPPLPITVLILLLPLAVCSGFSPHPQSAWRSQLRSEELSHISDSRMSVVPNQVMLCVTELKGTLVCFRSVRTLKSLRSAEASISAPVCVQSIPHS